MPRRGDNIRKRNDGRWEGRYKITDKERGIYKYKSVYAHSYREVKQKLSEIKADQSVDLLKPASTPTLGEVLAMWLDSGKIRLKKSTVRKYQFLINRHITPEIGAKCINEVSDGFLNEFIYDKLATGRLHGEGGLSTSYVSTIIIIIKSAILYAVDQKLCAPIAIRLVKPYAVKKNLSILNHQEQKKLEESLLTDMDVTKLGIYISLNTGLRIGEVCSLLWNDIDLNERIIHIRSTVCRVDAPKGSKQQTVLIVDTPKTKTSMRTIPISSKLYPVLQAMKQISSSSWVVSTGNNFISPRTYEYRFHKILDSCGVRSFNYHTLRHTFATRCIEAGVDIKSVSEILGHTNVGITMNTYVHSSIELKRKQLEKLSAY